MGEKIMDGFPSREEALADFFAAWEPARSVEYVALDDACLLYTSPSPRD